MKIHRICVFCGSRSGSRPEYVAAAKRLGRALAERRIELVYGGASVGTMGILADAALAAGGEVIGVIPESMVVKELAHEKLSELHMVDSMHQRKALMAELSDGFIAMPGGSGTLDEFFEIFTWAQLGYHHKPQVLVNIHGYYDSLLVFLEHAVTEGFLSAEHRDSIMIRNEPEAAVAALLRE